MNNDKDKFLFAEETVSQEQLPASAWKMLIVDDDPDIHEFVKAVLADFSFEGKNLTLLSAYTTPEAVDLVTQHSDISVVLLDVMMEEKESGLKFIRYLREHLKNTFIRIIICTGERDFAAEKNIILNYDINDYLGKTELNPGALFSAVVMAVRSFCHLQEIENSKQQLQDVVGATSRFVPKMFLKLLKKDSIADVVLSDYIEKQVTVLFLDIRSFTSISEFASPLDMFRFLNDCMSYLEPTIVQHDGFIDKYIGDAILALFPEKPDDAIAAGIQLLQSLEDYNYQRILKDRIPIKIGVGINTGRVVIGVVGFHDRTECTVIGDTVNVAERIEKSNKTFGSSILISEQTFLTMNDPKKFHYRSLGKVQMQGKKREITIYEIFDSNPKEMIALKQETKEQFEKAVQLYQTGDYLKSQRLFMEVSQKNPQDAAAKFFAQASAISRFKSGKKS